MLAQRMSAFGQSGTAKARAAAREARAAGKDIIDLSAGEIWCEPPAPLRAGAIAAIESGVARYTDTVGMEPLRSAIARTLSERTSQSWDTGEIAVTTGGKQALFNAAMAILDPGDEVIIPTPHWTTFPAQVTLAGARPVFLDTRATGYVPRADDLDRIATPATKAIIVNTPNNPTGAVYGRDALEAIAQFARDRDLWVIFDECYGAFAFPPFDHHPITTIAPEIRPRTLVVNAFSKQFAVTGWRLGYLAAPTDVIAAVKALQSHTTSNPNVIAQHAVLAMLEASEDVFTPALGDRLDQSRTLALEILADLKDIRLPPAQGGFYLYLDLARYLARRGPGDGSLDADDITAALLREAGVATVSGIAFGDPTGLRLSFGLPMPLLKRGLERLVITLNTLFPRQRKAPKHPALSAASA